MGKNKPRKRVKKRLRDIDSMKNLSNTAKGIMDLKEAMPLLGPILKEAGVDVNKMEDAFQKADSMAKQTKELVSIPDRFNNFFADQGWIMYSMMSLEVAREAVLKAESGDFQGAQEIILRYYDVKTVGLQLRSLNAIKAFKPRMDLALKGLNDYEEKRYHACIPVILALTDGLVNELHEDHKGFSAGTTQLEAWDSIAAHSQGLGKLVRILRKGRRKTTTEKINLPYRNGILHGTDLGYDNEIVAAKTWAVLFAVGEWAAKVERGETKAPEEKPKESITEILTKAHATEQFKREISEWKPRNIIPMNPESFVLGSPEYALNEFLSFWIGKNYGGMTNILPHKIIDTKAAPSKIRKHFKDKLLKSFEFVSIVDIALSNTTLEVLLQIEEDGRQSEKISKFVMIMEDTEGRPVGRTQVNSKWVSHTWKVY
ncbi:hypothetical protein [Paenibacillus sp. FSL H8-0537]|uniref:hypothetical protein n=1 Tax=Paenibacillus sp. FSL H8-0537 TaxID=2921399 RepID=UPI003100DA01